MQVILRTDIAGLGYKNDVVDVKAGYGRNYLIPQGFAVMATESNKKQLAENLKQASHKAEKIKKDAEDLAASIGDITIQLVAKVGDSGKIFGRVTNTQISDALKVKGFDVDRKKITIEDVKTVGTYKAILDLHKEVKHSLNVSVVGEE
ncbi:50S ribosomal protein L9 [Runella zeae]|jgi:large subunit ribosomal protein L9|uniref:50S ribosomal protein L9 n=1 Tax=Runella zeae TaxID=94255 RepID=UPI00040A4916|nr:50S ribosomal protein L9 [Runella zeae]